MIINILCFIFKTVIQRLLHHLSVLLHRFFRSFTEGTIFKIRIKFLLFVFFIHLYKKNGLKQKKMRKNAQSQSLTSFSQSAKN